MGSALLLGVPLTTHALRASACANKESSSREQGESKADVP